LTSFRRGKALAHPDAASGAFLLVVAVAYGAIGLRIPPGAGEPGPRALPIVLAAALAVLSTWVLVRGLRSGAGTSSIDVPDPTDDANARRPFPREASLAVIATLLCVAFFQPLGFVVTSLAYAGALVWLFGGNRRMIVGVSVATTAGLFVFFRLILGVRLPPGLLG
jgi:putative tricarboxylic transport membrane protein